MQKQKLPDLPYSYDALEPVIPENILSLHHNKHHAGYVKKANKALEKLRSNKADSYKHVLKDLSFNLNGHILHSTYWENMRKPADDNKPSSEADKHITDHFGSFDKFKKVFSEAAKSVEASGWTALLKNTNNEMRIMQIENHNKLTLIGWKLLLVVDVWEHAYYLEYKNDRDRYVESWWDVVNWDDVEKRML